MAHELKINSIVEKWKDSTLNIRGIMNSRNTANFDVNTLNTISVGQEVTIKDGATTVFGGTIETYRQLWLKGADVGNRKVYRIQCIDYNQLLDKSTKLAVSYVNETINTILTDTTSDRTIGAVLAAEGITLGSISGSSVVIKKAVFNYISVSDALNYIKDLTGLNWNVGYDKVLTLFYRSDNVGSMDSSLFYSINKEVTRLQYRNRQIIKAGNGKTATQSLESATPKPDGVSRTFLLRYPLAGKPQIFVDSVEVTASDIGINGIDIGKKWYYSYNSKQITHDILETVLSTSQTLEVTYVGLRPINVQAENTSGITARQTAESGTSGIYEDVVQKQELDEQQATADYANGLLLKYVDIPERVFINTSEYMPSGLIIPLTESKVDVDGEYLIENVSITESGGLFTYSYNLASGEALGSWVEFFRQLAEDATDFTIQENEVLIILASFNEAFKWEETLSVTITKYLSPQTDLFYLSDDIPYSGITGSSEVII